MMRVNIRAVLQQHGDTRCSIFASGAPKRERCNVYAAKNSPVFERRLELYVRGFRRPFTDDCTREIAF
jgi:hypothetical protein